MIRDRVLAILAAQARVPVQALDLSLPPAAQGLDSVAMVEALFAIEEAFDRALPYEAEQAPATLGDFLTLIEARLS
ncbi:acyl carrier protein [Rhodobacter sp. KR11]|jgi:acyl carrier protein|uniref:acyl carrier protein n=1 Tax=Rhodobacter sp. KR11 TaxID=2974588 RepID=UPI0022223BA1|nr:acyl carrier protein [Rhodobacter sp. KR11]MCW1917757.1 acyl carrier protein [Rhodobacter sp. KR11]